MEMKNSIIEFIGQDKNLNVRTIEKVNRRDLVKVFDMFIKNYGDLSFIDDNDEYIERINRIIDKNFRNENFNKYYNAIVLSFLFDSFNFLYQKNNYEKEVKSLLEADDTRSRIIKLLYEKEYLSPQRIAKELCMTPQNVCNNLAKIREYNLISSRNMIGDKKTVVYYLSFDCRREIKKYNSKRVQSSNIGIKRFDENNVKNIYFEMDEGLSKRREFIRKYE